MPVVAPIIPGLAPEVQAAAPVLNDIPTDRQILAVSHWANTVKSTLGTSAPGFQATGMR